MISNIEIHRHLPTTIQIKSRKKDIFRQVTLIYPILRKLDTTHQNKRVNQEKERYGINYRIQHRRIDQGDTQDEGNRIESEEDSNAGGPEVNLWQEELCAVDRRFTVESWDEFVDEYLKYQTRLNLLAPGKTENYIRKIYNRYILSSLVMNHFKRHSNKN